MIRLNGTKYVAFHCYTISQFLNDIFPDYFRDSQNAKLNGTNGLFARKDIPVDTLELFVLQV